MTQADWFRVGANGSELLQKLDTATKYPSIETYHRLGDRGVLRPTRTHEWPADQQIEVTEKIDGCNARVIFWEDMYIIGSRAELLTASGDLIWNNAMSIVDSLRDWAQEMLYGDHGVSPIHDRIVTFFFEVYGQRQTANWKQYSHKGEAEIRLLDSMSVHPDFVFGGQTVEQLAAWRDAGGQTFVLPHELEQMADATNTHRAPLLHRLLGKDLPITHEETAAFLREHSPYAQAGAVQGRSEGVVFRSVIDRSLIAKARYEDYARTARATRS